MSKPFNVRVYGIVIEDNQVLICDELINGYKMTKFPGGGLEFGEGTIDCVIREFNEEMNIEVEVIEHIYTTDFFQQSAFNSKEQMLSIYYKIKLLEVPQLNFKAKRYDFEGIENQIQFRWLDINSIDKMDLSFPIDQYVLNFIKP
jgi:ADP-ribose pyrophosphatase YjhB (NUDIX family)